MCRRFICCVLSIRQHRRPLMQLGILLSGTGYLVPSWEQGFAEAQAMGYTHVELAGNDVSGRGDKPDLGKVEVEEAQRIVARARDWGLSVSAIQSHQGFLQADRAAFEAAVAHTARMLDLAAACG
ncbi:MAG TPA: sugar phosphate isomerase/epimerase, partial [Armatimonadetes bacterium]|nr:sugar phosphate isomerase/epimerase [Armatimonadota bacterium]